MPTSRSAYFRAALFAVLCSLLAHAVLAQALAPQTGTISGRVHEGATGRSLQGAIVKVLGTAIEDYTDADGRFTLQGVPVGNQTIEVDYVGLDPFKQTIAVTSGSPVTLNADMKSEVYKLAAFEVAEAARGQALAINQQKTAQGIVNIVSEETFAAMNEGNIGYALQKLPGLSVNESEDGTPGGVNIRGLEGDFNSFQIDGNRISRGGFSTRNLVADGIANIEVIKAATPDRDGDAIGGIINVVSRSAFQRDGREIRFSASGTYIDYPDKWGRNLRLTYTDIFGILGQTKNLGVSVTVSDYTANRYYTNNDTDFNVLNRANNPTYNLPTDIFLYIPSGSSQTDLRETRSYGLNATIDFRTGPHHSFYFKPQYSHNELDTFRLVTRPYIDTRHQDIISGRKTFEVLQYDFARGSAGANGSRGEIRYQGIQNDNTNDIYSFGAGGKHELSSTKINYDAFVSRSHMFRPRNLNFVLRNQHVARGYIQWEYEYKNRQWPDFRPINGVDPRDLSGVALGNLTVEPEERIEETYTAKIDLEKKFVGERSASAIKIGAKYRENRPQFDQTVFSYTTGTAAQFPYAQVTSPVDQMVHRKQMYMRVDPVAVRQLLNTRPDLFTYVTYNSIRASAIEDFTAKETTTSAYAMDSLQIGRHTMIAGIRMERNTWDSRRKKIDQVTLRESPVENGNSYVRWLPGIHFRHELRKNLILRESYNRSYGRPQLNRLTLGRSEDINGNIAQGNPFLDPTESDNFDVQIEQYTQQGGLYSVGVFYKKMKGFYYNQIFKFDTFDEHDNPIPNPNGLRQFQIWQNAKGAENKGIELIAQQKLYFLPGPLKGLSALASATFTDSVANYPDRPGEKLPTYGFSDYMFNGAVEYVQGNFRGRVSYRYRSDYLEGIDTSAYIDDWFAAREQVDVELSYRLTRKLRLYANGENLTWRPQASFQGSKRFVEDFSQYGARYTFGIDFTF